MPSRTLVVLGTPTEETVEVTPTGVSYQEAWETAWAEVTPATIATPLPFAEGDEFYTDLIQRGHTIEQGSSVITPDGYVFSAYLFTEPTYGSRFGQSDYETPGCRLAFYRTDGTQNSLVRYFPAPKYPEEATYAGYPVTCRLHEWTGYSSQSLWAFPPDMEFVRSLGIDGMWSDINDNGWPEIAVTYQYCANACLNYGAIATHIYEIQSNHQVVNLTADLPGVIEYFWFIRSHSPLTVYVYDPTLWYYYKSGIIDTWWIYQWDTEANALVDVSQNYPQFYHAQVDAVLDSLEQYASGGVLREAAILAPLFIYEKGQMRETGYELFMEISNLSLWSDFGDEEKCWLQITRATVTEQFLKGEPFKFPATDLDGYVPFADSAKRSISLLPQNKYDFSFCAPFVTEP